MITVERIDKAIELCNKKIAEIPQDEIVPENKDYMKWEKLRIGLEGFKLPIINIDKVLTEIGV